MENKRKESLIWSVTAIVCAIMVVGFSVGVSIRNSIVNKTYTYYINDVEVREISRESEIPINDYQEKTVHVSAFEKATIKVKKEIQTGTIDIQVLTPAGFNIATNNSDEYTIEIEPGEGEYRIKVNTTDFAGSYNISWKIKDVKGIEKINIFDEYEIYYNSKKLKHVADDLYDIFKFDTQENNENIYMKIYTTYQNNIERQDEEFFKDIEGAAVPCTIGREELSGKYGVKHISVDDVNYSLYKFFIPLNNGKIILIEMSFDDGNSLGYKAEVEFNEMLNMLKVK